MFPLRRIAVGAVPAAATTATPALAAPERGTSKANALLGGSSADRLYGLGGEDRLYGRAGLDLLNGGTNADLLEGEIG